MPYGSAFLHRPASLEILIPSRSHLCLCCSHCAHATSTLGWWTISGPPPLTWSVFNGCCSGFASTWHQRPVLPCLQCMVPSFLWVTTPGTLEPFSGVFPKSDCRGYQLLPRRVGYTFLPWLPYPCWAHSRLHLPLGKHSPAASEFCQTLVMGRGCISLPSMWVSRGPQGKASDRLCALCFILQWQAGALDSCMNEHTSFDEFVCLVTSSVNSPLVWGTEGLSPSVVHGC